jgi:hypothetical protein
MRLIEPGYALTLQRFEIAIIIVTGAALAALTLVATSQMYAATPAQACFVDWFSEIAVPPESLCGRRLSAFFATESSLAQPLGSVILVAPLFAGGVLGVGLLTRDLESGGVDFIWALTASHLRWLWLRAAPILLVLVVAVVPLSLLALRMADARQPWAHGQLGFLQTGISPAVVVGNAILAFSVGALSALLTRRALSAAIVTAVVLSVVFVAITTARQAWAGQESLNHVRDTPYTLIDYPGGTVFRSISVFPDGLVLDDEDAINLAPPDVDSVEWLEANSEAAYAGVPGSMYGDWERMELGVLGLAIVVVWASLLVLLPRRWPG